MERTPVVFVLNGREREAWIWPHQTLLEVLRVAMGATEVRYGCGEGICGTCTVLLDGESVNSCLVFAVQAAGRGVTTVKGLVEEDDVALHPLQEGLLQHGASQCGFCTPGMLLTIHEFLAQNPSPSRKEIRRALAGNLCRCTGYTKIVDTVEAYIRARRETGSERSGGHDGAGGAR